MFWKGSSLSATYYKYIFWDEDGACCCVSKPGSLLDSECLVVCRSCECCFECAGFREMVKVGEYAGHARWMVVCVQHTFVCWCERRADCECWCLCLSGPVDPSFRALSGRPTLTVRRHTFNEYFSLSLWTGSRTRLFAEPEHLLQQPNHHPGAPLLSFSWLLSTLELSDTKVYEP